MERLGFYVCVADLEDELIRAHGAASVEEVVDAQGDLGSFRTLQKQPEWRGRPTEDAASALHGQRRPPEDPLRALARRDARSQPRCRGRSTWCLLMSELSVARRVQVRLRSPRSMRWIAPALYVAALSAYMWREGIPVGRERLLLWIVLGLLALSTTNLGGWLRSVIFEWLPLALVLAVYDLLRGHADGLLFSAWYRPQLEADSFLVRWHRPHGLASGSALARAVARALVRLRVLGRLRELLPGDVRGRRVALVLRARALSAVRRLVSRSSRAWRSPRSRSSPPRRRGSRAGKASSTRRHV